MILAKEELNILIQSISFTWTQIGADVLRYNPKMSNRACIETVLDANHMSTNDKSYGKEAELLVSAMISDAGYAPTLNYLARKVKLN